MLIIDTFLVVCGNGTDISINTFENVWSYNRFNSPRYPPLEWCVDIGITQMFISPLRRVELFLNKYTITTKKMGDSSFALTKSKDTYIYFDPHAPLTLWTPIALGSTHQNYLSVFDLLFSWYVYGEVDNNHKIMGDIKDVYLSNTQPLETKIAIGSPAYNGLVPIMAEEYPWVFKSLLADMMACKCPSPGGRRQHVLNNLNSNAKNNNNEQKNNENNNNEQKNNENNKNKQKNNENNNNNKQKNNENNNNNKQKNNENNNNTNNNKEKRLQRERQKIIHSLQSNQNNPEQQQIGMYFIYNKNKPKMNNHK